MDKLGVQELRNLVKMERQPCVSIFFPTYRSGSVIKQNPVRLKNLLNVAREYLIDTGTDADRLLDPAAQLLSNEDFWSHPADGIALFACDELFRCYRLPINFKEQVLVGPRFLIRPVLSLLNNDQAFYLLAISENKVRLFSGSRYSLEELPITKFPRNLKEAMQFNDPERQLQLHTQTPRIPGARAAAIFHGHGVGIDDEKDNLAEFVKQIDDGLKNMLRDKKPPMVVAAVDSLFHTYRKTNSYPKLLPEPVRGNPDLRTDQELLNESWKILLPFFEREKEEAIHLFTELSGSSLASNDIEQILSGSKQGRVRYLFVNNVENWWGKYEDNTGQLDLHAAYTKGDEEIISLTVAKALLTDATVYDIMPARADYPDVFAVFRY